MSATTTESAFNHRQHVVEVLVNNRFVRLPAGVVKGLEIKQAAIKQGLCIELDFVLSELRQHHAARVIGDEDTVRINKQSRFSAVAGDDNS
jgi:hypothetical protein